MIAFLETTGDRHAQVVGGLTALERRIREVAKAGATRAVVAAAPVEIARPLPIPVEYVAPGSAAPEGAQRERADVIAGIELVDEAARGKRRVGADPAHEQVVRGPGRRADQLAVLDADHARARASVARGHAEPRARSRRSSSACSRAAREPRAGRRTSRSRACCSSSTRSSTRATASSRGCAISISKLGQWLDNLVRRHRRQRVPHRGRATALGGVWLWLGLAAACGRVLVSLVDVPRRLSPRPAPATCSRSGGGSRTGKATADDVYDPKAITTWLRSFGRRDTFVFVWMLACLAGFPYWVVGPRARDRGGQRRPARAPLHGVPALRA